MVMGDMVMTVDVVVIGAGPGGCAAAFRAAELGLDVALVDSSESPGGNYLNTTCIPHQILLTTARQLHQIDLNPAKGLSPIPPELDLQQIQSKTTDIIQNETTRLTQQCEQLGVLYVKGKAFFENSTTIRLKDSEVTGFSYKYAIIATGASPIPFNEIELTGHKRIVSSSEALEITQLPKNLLIVGAGHTGLELANIYSSFGCEVDLVDEESKLLTGIDDDLITFIENNNPKFSNSISLNTRVTNIIETKDGVSVAMVVKNDSVSKSYELVIIATGHTPASENLGLENTSVQCNASGYISTDSEQKTTDPNIFAVGDVINGDMYSHIAKRQGNVAAEVISGIPSAFDVRAIPYTINITPSISWCGLTESEATSSSISVKVETHEWKNSLHSKINGNVNGLTKIISCADSGRVLGAAIVGLGSADLISEACLAIEMGALVEDLSLTLHSHPSPSEILSKTAQKKPHQ